MLRPVRPVWVTLPLLRGVPFDDDIVFETFDFTGATMTLQVRDYLDAPGDPLINLANAAPTAQGLSVTTETVNGVIQSRVRIIIAEATIENLKPWPNGTKPGEPVALYYGLHITPSGGIKGRWAEGDCPIWPGANKA